MDSFVSTWERHEYARRNQAGNLRRRRIISRRSKECIVCLHQSNTKQISSWFDRSLFYHQLSPIFLVKAAVIGRLNIVLFIWRLNQCSRRAARVMCNDPMIERATHVDVDAVVRGPLKEEQIGGEEMSWTGHEHGLFERHSCQLDQYWSALIDDEHVPVMPCASFRLYNKFYRFDQDLHLQTLLCI